MEIGAEKTKLMTNSANVIYKDIKAKGQRLSTVSISVTWELLSQPEVLSRIEQATAALKAEARLERIFGQR